MVAMGYSGHPWWQFVIERIDGGNGLQRDGGGGSMTMSDRQEGVESPGALGDDCATRVIFDWFQYSFETTSHSAVAYRPKRGGILFYDVAWVNCKQGATNDIKVQAHQIWSKGYGLT